MSFLKVALREPSQVWTSIFTSRSLIKKLVTPLSKDPYCSVLEVGTGVGVVTKQINKLTKSSDSYIGIEINQDLHHYLQHKFPKFNFICGSPESIDDQVGSKKFDLVVSTLSWSQMDRSMQDGILLAISNHLEKGGYFKTYLFVSSLLTSSGKNFEKNMSKYFSINTSWVFFNLIPAKVYQCRLKKMN